MIKNTLYALAILFLCIACGGEDSENFINPETDGFTLNLNISNATEDKVDLGTLTVDVYGTRDDWRKRENRIFRGTAQEGDQSIFIPKGIKAQTEHYLDIYTSDGKYDNWEAIHSWILVSNLFTEAPSGSTSIRISESDRQYIGTYTFEPGILFSDSQSIETELGEFKPKSLTINADYSATIVDLDSNGNEVVNTLVFAEHFKFESPLTIEKSSVIVPKANGAIRFQRMDGSYFINYVLEPSE